ncbi:hypothetical protein [Lipingzhangella halophila]
MGRKRGEIGAGIVLALLGGTFAVLSAGQWGGTVLGILLVIGGAALAWHGVRIAIPVLEVEDAEFRYKRGDYIVRIPFSEVGSYYVLPGRTRSLGLCDAAGRPRHFPSTQGRRASRPYLPLTGLTSPEQVHDFMTTAGIPPRDRSLTSGSGTSRHGRA